MSRVGSSAIAIPSGVTVSQQGGLVVVKGKNGELSAPLHNEVELTVVGEVATVKPRRKTKISQSLWGTMRATICLLYTSPSPRDRQKSRMPSSA